MKIKKTEKIVIGIISICAIAFLSYWLIEKSLVYQAVTKNQNLTKSTDVTNPAESFAPDETHFVTPVMTFVGKFMEARLENNQPLAESFLTDNAKKQYSQPGLTLVGTSNPHFVNRDLLGCQKKSEDKYLCKVRIYEGLTADEKATDYFDEYLTVIKSDNKYLVDSVQREKYVNISKSKPYLNTNYGFTLSSNPNQSKSYTDYPDRCSFQVIPIATNCGDIAKNCPPAKVIPGFKWYPASKRPPLALTQKITFPNNPVPFCFAKGIPEMGTGSIYDSYYYLTTTKDNRCFAIHFVVHKPNCEMFGIKEQIDKCHQGNERLDRIPNEYMETFKFVTASH